MNFLNKAKQSLKDLEGDLNKATQALGIGDKEKSQAPSDSTAAVSDASSTGGQYTPATSAAPSTAAVPKTKLPMVVRKSVRDDWESKQPDIESKLSSAMGTSWKIEIDAAYLYSFAKDDFAKQDPGRMFDEYFTSAVGDIQEWVSKNGDAARDELNNLASAHVLTLQPAEDAKDKCSCDISGSQLRILFSKGFLGYNIRDSMIELSAAVNAAGVLASGGSGGAGGTPLDFHARSSISKHYEPAIGAVQHNIQKILDLPVLTLTPNFETNFSKLTEKNAKDPSDHMRDWQVTFGKVTLEYFEQMAKNLEEKGFGKDDMLQEGFKESVEKNEIALRVVDKFTKGNYNECVLENGVLIMQTTQKYWWTNMSEVGLDVIDLL